jgi:leader peptidase (prepilin peptidase)/N-methyltransferase
VGFDHVFVFLIGACIGSFLNVCVYRIPKRLSLIRPGSHCPRCGSPVRWWDNIPILSYILLRGRCRDCGVRISVQYPLIESLTALFLLLVYYQFGFSVSFIGYSIFSVLLILIFFIDLHHLIIPDLLTVPGIGLGVLFTWLAGRAPAAIGRPWLAEGLRESLIGAVVGASILLLAAYLGKLAYKKDVMGGGDVNLAAMVGAFLGWKFLLLTLFISFLSGSVAGLILVGARRKTMASQIPFGPFIAGSALFVLIHGEGLLAFYLSKLYV